MSLENPMFAHFYRKEYGDAGFRQVLILADEIGDLESKLEEALLDRFNDPKPRMLPPNKADIRDGEGKLLMRLYVVNSASTMRAVLSEADA